MKFFTPAERMSGKPSMKMKIVIGSVVIAAALVFGAISFVQTNVEYTDFQTAVSSHKKVQVKGEWLKEKESAFDAASGKFSFYMKDDAGREMQVVYDGAKPNNFEMANAIVVKGQGLWVDYASIPFEIEPPRDPPRDDFTTPRQRLAYRQAAMFVAWLRERDPKAFVQLLLRIENGASFRDSFHASYATSPSEQWRNFVSRLSK